MKATAAITEEEAFWRGIGASPQDQLPRLVFADWLEERGRHEEADALRATADRVPWKNVFRDFYGWWEDTAELHRGDDQRESLLPRELMLAMADSPNREDHMVGVRFTPGSAPGACILYRSAMPAVRDLVRAWVVTRSGGAT